MLQQIVLAKSLDKQLEITYSTTVCWPVPVAARSKALVFDHSPAEIVGLNPTGGTDVYLMSVVRCHVEVYATD